MPLPIISVKLTAQQQTQFATFLDAAQAKYGPLILAWPRLTPIQRRAVVANCPLLARLYRMALAIVQAGGTE